MSWVKKRSNNHTPYKNRPQAALEAKGPKGPGREVGRGLGGPETIEPAKGSARVKTSDYGHNPMEMTKILFLAGLIVAAFFPKQTSTKLEEMAIYFGMEAYAPVTKNWETLASNIGTDRFSTFIGTLRDEVKSVSWNGVQDFVQLPVRSREAYAQCHPTDHILSASANASANVEGLSVGDLSSDDPEKQ